MGRGVVGLNAHNNGPKKGLFKVPYPFPLTPLRVPMT